MMETLDKQMLLPHHIQQELCVTRAPYRQGRRLTAVKVYSVTKESNHLLVFGVPSLNLRQEAKALFIKFGKLLQFNISKDHVAEPFTETYHACYEKIQSARIAKKMLDTKNFYGSSLHVCYAPELETIEETEQKLKQRERDVLFRLRNLHNIQKVKEDDSVKSVDTIDVIDEKYNDKKLINMGEINLICTGKDFKKTKRKINEDIEKQKRFKPCFVDDNAIVNEIVCDDSLNIHNDKDSNSSVDCTAKDRLTNIYVKDSSTSSDGLPLEVVDCTSVDKIVVSNINEALNYDKFGKEAIFKIPSKPINKIKFNLNKKSFIYCLFYF